MSDSPASQEQLAQLVQDRTDEEITGAVQEQGIDSVLDQIFTAMQERFQPDKAAGQEAVIQWDVTAPDGTHTRQLKVSDGSCEVLQGAPEAPRVTLALSLPDFLRFVAGTLDPMQAFMSGRLRVSGDLMFAQTMGAWFATS